MAKLANQLSGIKYEELELSDNLMSNKWLITENLDKVEAQCKDKYVESDYASLYRYDWRVNEKNEDLTLFLAAYIESAKIKGYLAAITDFRLMLEGVDVDVGDILDE